MQARCGSGHPCGCWWISWGHQGNPVQQPLALTLAPRGRMCSSARGNHPRPSRAGGCHARCPVSQVPPPGGASSKRVPLLVPPQPWSCWLVSCTSRGGSMEGHGGVIPGVAHMHPGAVPFKPGRVPSRSSFSEPHLDGFWVFHPTQVPSSVSYTCLSCCSEPGLGGGRLWWVQVRSCTPCLGHPSTRPLGHKSRGRPTPHPAP